MEIRDDKSNVIDISQKVSTLVEKEKEKYGFHKKDSNNFSSQDILSALNANEDGDAWLFVNLFRNKFCYDHADKKWFKWSSNYWEEDYIEEVLASIDAVVELYSEENSRQSVARSNAAKIQDDKAGL